MARPKKTTHFRITKFVNGSSGNISWRVAGTKKDGIRIRKNFADRSDAIQKHADLELEFSGAEQHRKALRTSLRLDQLAEAESATELLKGESLSRVTSHYLNLRDRCRTMGADLEQAVSFFENHYRKEIQSVTILNAAEEFLATRHGLSDATKKTYRTGLRLLQKRDPNKEVHTFTVKDIEESLRKYRKVGSLRSFRRTFSVFFHWAVRHHYALENPCERLDRLPKEISQIAMLSLEECVRLLFAAVMYQEGSSAAAIAIALFAGLRPSELEDLKPEDIGKSFIRVSGGKLRRQLKRTVPIPPVLESWIQWKPFTGLPAGWDYKLKLLKKATAAAKWVPDILRHTSISFQSERDANEALTAFNCGTSIQMMNLHYRHTIDDAAVIEEFWKLTPNKILERSPVVVLPQKNLIAWPSKPDLAKLVWSKSLVQVAGMIGVSDVALRKHCIKQGIELPSRGQLKKSQI